jgi:maltooligosyltrehalose trehalohydrolase
MVERFKWRLDIGASVMGGDAARFRVWAPHVKRLSVKVYGDRGTMETDLTQDRWGYYEGIAENVREFDRYYYVLDGMTERPDPASRFQPEGVHGPSQVIDPFAFRWADGEWKGIPLADYIIYELHVGVFTKEGTFESVINFLDYLSELGVTAVELMPVCQFPGDWNWGYDGVYPFAPQNSYGGPTPLKRLVDACHGKGLAVILDVVYNHLGPEGNYLESFAPDYFTDRYKTPWGNAINFDGPLSDHVRHYLISNALYWITEYHIDALRIDAIQGIFDLGAHHFLKELAEAVHRIVPEVGRELHVIAESDLNDVKVIDPLEIGGYGLDAVWNDDFHHALHSLITGDRLAYYRDFGELSHMAKALSEGYVYSGQYSPCRRRRHGNSSRGRPAHQFIVFSQNHDQTNNGLSRPVHSESLAQLKLRAGMVLLSPYVPLLFMGEEYAETAPFHYFVSYPDHGLNEAIRTSRSEEFAALWHALPPDPELEKTFLDSKIGVGEPRSAEQDRLCGFYRMLIRVRKEIPALASLSKERLEIKMFDGKEVIFMRRWCDKSTVFALFNFNGSPASVEPALPLGSWEKVLDSSAADWGGDGSRSPDLLRSSGEASSVEVDRHGLVLYRLTGMGWA